jgi:hypothetical protein
MREDARLLKVKGIEMGGTHMDLTNYAAQGFAGEPNRHCCTSPAHWAWALGVHLRRTGGTLPRDVRMGRGHSIRAESIRFKIHGSSDRPTFEQVTEDCTPP